MTCLLSQGKRGNHTKNSDIPVRIHDSLYVEYKKFLVPSFSVRSGALNTLMEDIEKR